jgi:hypothetical protein
MELYDEYEIIEKQNNKSKDIIEQYEKNAKKRKESCMNEVKILEIEINNLKTENKILEEKEKVILNSNIKDFELLDQLNEQMEKNQKEINSLESKCGHLSSINKYPHGNGIYGFALAYLEASNEINIQWTNYIWTWTILGYKKVYPTHAHSYIEYKKDIETSQILMYKIVNYVRSKNKNPYQLFYDDWINEINSYLEEKNIEIDENIVFRPNIHEILKEQHEEYVEYFRITKSDLEKKDDEDDDFDYFYFQKNDEERLSL